MARIAAEVLGASPFPALVLEIPSERIVAAGLQAAQLLDPSGASVIDHMLEEFTSDRPDRGVGLLAGGRLGGFEAFRILRRARGADVKVRMWVRIFEQQPPTRLVLVVLVPERSRPGPAPLADWQDVSAVMGTTDVSMVVDRISSDAEDLFGVPVDDILGRSLLDLVAEADGPTLKDALEEASSRGAGVTISADVQLRTADQVAPTVTCEILLLPLQPTPSSAFVLLPSPMNASPGYTSETLSSILTRLGRGAAIAELARGVLGGTTERDVPGVGRLTTRELEIVGGILDGDRAPAIATRLFLTQSTVRNHLAAVYGKLGVHSQQGLLNLFRHGRSKDDGVAS